MPRSASGSTGPGALPAPLGQEHALVALRRLDPAGARTLLFAGPDGIGRRLAARWYAARLNCDQAGEGPCGHCPSCLGYVVDDDGVVGATDYREISASATTRDGRVAKRPRIGIDRLVSRPDGDPEPLGPWLESPPRHRRRVGVIDGAEHLTASAANAFLKTLEEPPRHACIVLVAPGPDAVLPTVASRCVVVRFRPVEASPEDWAAHAPHPALRLGRPGPLARAGVGPFAVAREAVAQLVGTLDGPLAASFEASSRLGDVWEHGDDLVPGMLREHARARSTAAYVRADALVDEAEAALERYAHRGLALKRLTLGLRRVWRES